MIHSELTQRKSFNINPRPKITISTPAKDRRSQAVANWALISPSPKYAAPTAQVEGECPKLEKGISIYVRLFYIMDLEKS